MAGICRRRQVTLHDQALRPGGVGGGIFRRGVFRRSSLSNDGDRMNLLAHPDALSRTRYGG